MNNYPSKPRWLDKVCLLQALMKGKNYVHHKIYGRDKPKIGCIHSFEEMDKGDRAVVARHVLNGFYGNLLLRPETSARLPGVIPAKAGIRNWHSATHWKLWIPAFAGMTDKTRLNGQDAPA